jgi:protein-disulfide isomerase
VRPSGPREPRILKEPDLIAFVRLRRISACVLLVLLCVNVASAQETRSVAPALLASLLQSSLTPAGSHGVHGDVTLVEYFDYNCPICRALEPALRTLLANDSKVRLVRKDWTLFGDGSVYAAYASFAAAREGKYQAAHDALITSSRDLDTKADVLSVLQAAGFDVARIDSDVTHHEQEYANALARVKQEAATLGLHGTPGIIVGNQLVVGGRTDYARLQRLVAEARRQQ